MKKGYFSPRETAMTGTLEHTSATTIVHRLRG